MENFAVCIWGYCCECHRYDWKELSEMADRYSFYPSGSWESGGWGPDRKMKRMALGYGMKTYLQIRAGVKMILLIRNPQAWLKKA